MTRRMRFSRSCWLLLRNCSAAVVMLSSSERTLICVTASTLTATPCDVYRSCLGATSKDISSSGKTSARWVRGMTSLEPPVVIFVGNRRFTLSLWCILLIDKPFPGINLCNSVLIVYHNHFLAAFKTPPVSTSCSDTLAQPPRGGVDDFTQAILGDSDTDFSEKPRTVHDILYCIPFTVTEYAAKHYQQQYCDNEPARTCE